MLNVENLTKSYGGNVLFEEVSFKINSRERVGLVGRNGHGKTTLLRLITGQESWDSGNLTIPRNYRIGYVQQHIAFTRNTVLEEGMTGLPEHEKDHYWKVEKVLSGLGFSTHDMNRSPDEFSGGYQVRLNLAKVLVSDPDLLLLDEPTNYLDITSIRWIEGFLNSWPRELMLITHDRGFMDRIVTHTVGIHRRKIRKVSGNTEKYYEQIAQEEEIYEKTRVNDEKRRKEMELFISRFRAKARLANMVQSRIKTLEKMEKKDILESQKNLDFSFRAKPFPAKYILSVNDIAFGYTKDQPLIRDLEFTLGAGERICIIGKNGKGKTTLLKLLAGQMAPATGTIKYHPSAEKGFYEQTNVQSLVDSRTVEEEILMAHGEVDRQHARNVCGAMMFEGDDATKRISILSGGEKSRVMLGKLLVTPLNMLLLDEPTNHLDMESCDALLAAIDNFPGTVIMVTHNEMFLHALADRLIVFQNDRTEVFHGSYQDFLDKRGWADERKDQVSSGAPVVDDAPANRLTKKELRRRRSEIITEKGRALKPLETKISRIEKDIERHENDLGQLNDAMVQASQAQDSARITELSQTIHHCQETIDRLFDDLETLTTEFEEKQAVFEDQLAQLEMPVTAEETA